MIAGFEQRSSQRCFDLAMMEQHDVFKVAALEGGRSKKCMFEQREFFFYRPTTLEP